MHTFIIKERPGRVYPNRTFCYIYADGAFIGTRETRIGAISLAKAHAFDHGWTKADCRYEIASEVPA